MSSLWTIAIGLAVSLAVLWLALAVTLLLARPRAGAMKEILRLLPDTLRLLRNVAADRAVPRGVRIRLWIALAYLVMPIDLVPDFIPVVGVADDAIVLCIALRAIARKAGSDVLRRNWPGTEQGLAAVQRAAGVPAPAPA